MSRNLSFNFVKYDRADTRWKAAFDKFWPAYRRWYLSEGIAHRQTFVACEKSLRAHMPELFAIYQDLISAQGVDDTAARFLSMYCPPAYVTGCSQIGLWSSGQPVLFRSYDYSPRLFEGTVALTNWGNTRVISTIDSLWGCLDGINEFGLAVSLAFGGSRATGVGFGIPIILRYVLQTCDTTQQAIEALNYVPCHMAYNITLNDCSGDARTVEIAPGTRAKVLERPYATNHQSAKRWEAYVALARSEERASVLEDLSKATHRPTTQDLFASFQKPPLRSYAYNRGFGTLYSCLMSPRAGDVDYIWDTQLISQSFDDFREMTVTVALSDAPRTSSRFLHGFSSVE
ncbi:hypothetical protein FGK63_09980 [Ruegeria sediminis]|uniref:Peptidase C45 hydrolase domain-containing protein n=1 Tax=Ruegeria sediminis TaxID=2583820 RepID=A0ABY2WY31_9RHOB|nr:C45 family peptidase [Ruegeria sediminis]TMV07782.1 hypothetical protein FGK63_09980 [Ruegeria sediminis]